MKRSSATSGWLEETGRVHLFCETSLLRNTSRADRRCHASVDADLEGARPGRPGRVRVRDVPLDRDEYAQDYVSNPRLTETVADDDDEDVDE